MRESSASDDIEKALPGSFLQNFRVEFFEVKTTFLSISEKTMGR
jgi:hypothetical protein